MDYLEGRLQDCLVLLDLKSKSHNDIQLPQIENQDWYIKNLPQCGRELRRQQKYGLFLPRI